MEKEACSSPRAALGAFHSLPVFSECHFVCLELWPCREGFFYFFFCFNLTSRQMFSSGPTIPLCHCVLPHPCGGAFGLFAQI